MSHSIGKDWWLFKRILCQGKPYLDRYRLWVSKNRTRYLHRFRGPDVDPELHNHPWDKASSFIIWGGYTEQFRHVHADGTLGPLQIRTHKAPSYRTWDGADFHKIISVQPNTWTLFFGGKRVRDWGFLITRAMGWAFRWEYHVVPHKVYLQANTGRAMEAKA